VQQLLFENCRSTVSTSELQDLWLETCGAQLSPAAYGHATLDELLASEDITDVLRVTNGSIRRIFNRTEVIDYVRKSQQLISSSQNHVSAAEVIQDTCQHFGVAEWRELGVESKYKFPPLIKLMKLEARIDLHVSCYVIARYG
jgi:hypothetical protein